MRLECVGGGPWDGRVVATDLTQLRVPIARHITSLGISPPSDIVDLARYHVYRREVVTCAEGCCQELALVYAGESP